MTSARTLLGEGQAKLTLMKKKKMEACYIDFYTLMDSLNFEFNEYSSTCIIHRSITNTCMGCLKLET